MIATGLVLGCVLLALGSALWAFRGPAAECVPAGAALIGIGRAAVALGADPVREMWRFALDPALGVDRLSGWLLAVIGFVLRRRVDAGLAHVRRPGTMASWPARSCSRWR